MGPITLLIYCAAYKVFYHDSYFFDPKHGKPEEGDFAQHATRYQDLAKLAITISSAVIAFLISTLSSAKQPITSFVQKIEITSPIVVGFFGFTVASLIAFMLAQTHFYEEYCHSHRHDSYKRWKYVLCISLGWSGLLSFILGFGWLATNIFNSTY